jgi:Ni/Co efflux regulator RcnB
MHAPPHSAARVRCRARSYLSNISLPQESTKAKKKATAGLRERHTERERDSERERERERETEREREKEREIDRCRYASIQDCGKGGKVEEKKAV